MICRRVRVGDLLICPEHEVAIFWPLERTYSLIVRTFVYGLAALMIGGLIGLLIKAATS